MPKAPSRYLLLPIVLSAALGACANNSSQPGSASATDETKLPEEQVMPQTRVVTGSIGYRERIALPPGSAVLLMSMVTSSFRYSTVCALSRC